MNKRTTSLWSGMLTALVLLSGPVHAEDIDIYARPPTPSGDTNPNILIVIDNSANWAAANQGWPGGIKQGESELRAVRTVAGELNSRVNVGLMMFTAGNGAGTHDGGYVRFKIRPMDQTNKSALSELIGYATGCIDGPNSLNGTPNCILKNFSSGPLNESIGTSNTDYSAVMFEVFKYFGGYTSPLHANDDVAGTPVDNTHFGPLRYAGNPDLKSDPYAFTPTTDVTRTTYNPPITANGGCARNYVIFIGNGFPNQDSPATLLTGVGGDATQFPLNNLSTTSTTSTTTSLVTTTACGTYPDIPGCQAGALATYGTLYDTYSCTLASTCTAGSITTTALGTTACNQYTTSAACLTGTQTSFPGYTSYSCASSTATCTVPQATTASNNVVMANSACIPDNLANATNCNTYGALNFPGYSGFTCNATSNCGAGGKTWNITATTVQVPGVRYDQVGTLNNLVSSDSHNIYGTATRTVTAATPTGSFSVPTGTTVRNADEWASFLARTDISPVAGKQSVSTFTIDVYKDQQDVNQTALLMSMARNGGGKYFAATNEQAIITALRKIVSEIQAVDSVFASSSLPVSVNTQGTYLNQVFMGMFRPDGTSAPRWAGNLKQYKLKMFNGELKLSDALGFEAISATTGFISPCATSFWSTDTGTYWNYAGSQATGDCLAITSSYPTPGSPSLYSDSPDGQAVEKGGAGQKLRGVDSSSGTLVTLTQNYQVCAAGQSPLTSQCRKLMTCDGSGVGSCAALTSFDVSNAAITATALNIPVATDRDNMINWIRGQDIDNENGNFDTLANPIINEVRPSVHGGVIHAQPGVIDYGGAIGVVSFYGSDDGVFHAVTGNQTPTNGKELWGFIAPETYGRFWRLRDNGVNTPLISFPSDPATARPAGTTRKDYFFDGSLGVYQANARVWIFASMRRGGRAIYAFDVTNPAAPIIKWRKGCFTNNTGDDSMCSTGWTSIGQTWSRPTVGYLQGYVDATGKNKPILIFGGGYDSCQDNDSSAPCTGTPKGSAIWFVDADTGAIIRTYPTTSSVPGDVGVIADDVTGIVGYVYATDMTGNVYRINVGSYDGTTLTNWTANTSAATTKIAALSETGQARRILNGPSVVAYIGYNAVLVGTGDREHPLINSYACNNYAPTVTNQFYMIKDTPTAYPASPITPGMLTDVTNNTTATVAQIGSSGWKFNLGPCENTVNKPLTVAGITYFGTNRPAQTVTSSCNANLGIATGYAVDFTTGAPAAAGRPRAAEYIGGGMPPSPVAGIVEVDGQRMLALLGGVDTTKPNNSAEQGQKPPFSVRGDRKRSYWYTK